MKTLARKGLNATFSYQVGPKTRAYRLRASGVSHGVSIVAQESSARIRKVFYPHHLTMSGFSVRVDLIGEDEFVSFSNWVADYLDYAMAHGSDFSIFPTMDVSVPSHRFSKSGIPLTGYQWGDAVGKMVWSQDVNFMGVEDNRDRQKFGGSWVTANTSPYYPQPEKDNVSMTTLGQAIGTTVSWGDL